MTGIVGSPSSPAERVVELIDVEDVVVAPGRTVVVGRNRVVVVEAEASRAAMVWPSSGTAVNGPPATRMPRTAPAARMRAATHRWFKTNRV